MIRSGTSKLNNAGEKVTVGGGKHNKLWNPPKGGARDKGRRLSPKEIIALGYQVAVS